MIATLLDFNNSAQENSKTFELSPVCKLQDKQVEFVNVTYNFDQRKVYVYDGDTNEFIFEEHLSSFPEDLEFKKLDKLVLEKALNKKLSSVYAN